jgi:hypothetical protein
MACTGIKVDLNASKCKETGKERLLKFFCLSTVTYQMLFAHHDYAAVEIGNSSDCGERRFAVTFAHLPSDRIAMFRQRT